jgi:two-component system response regulator
VQQHQPILLVEDSAEDVEATIRALRKAGLANPIHHCQDGEEALDYLKRRGKYADARTSPRPGVVLLDLNLPGTDGRQVLAEAKADPQLKRIPVIILTTSSDERDIRRCYEMGANSYVNKPVDLDGFLKAIQRLSDYWFEVVILPKSAEH